MLSLFYSSRGHSLIAFWYISKLGYSCSLCQSKMRPSDRTAASEDRAGATEVGVIWLNRQNDAHVLFFLSGLPGRVIISVSPVTTCWDVFFFSDVASKLCRMMIRSFIFPLTMLRTVSYWGKNPVNEHLMSYDSEVWNQATSKWWNLCLTS